MSEEKPTQTTPSTKDFRAAMTTCGQSALRQFAKQPFDLVLADLAMPEMKGWQVLEKLKGLKNPPKVVNMTGYVPQEGESILFDRKADEYLVKPVDAARAALQAQPRAPHGSRRSGR